jgi:hypothetical protein
MSAASLLQSLCLLGVVAPLLADAAAAKEEEAEQQDEEAAAAAADAAVTTKSLSVILGKLIRH